MAVCLSATLSEETQKKQIETESVPHKSKVWKRLGHPVKTKNGVWTIDKSQTVCKICFTAVLYCSNTTNMTMHLRRVFSTAGSLLVTAQRAALGSENVDMMVFLKKNL